jgi:uncharacterized protein (TIGR03437 family)
MNRNWKTAVFAAAFYAVASSQPTWAQVAPTTILTVDVENLVQYIEDTSDVTKFATDPNRTISSTPRNFALAASIGDIVAVNGQRAKGTMTRNTRQLNLTTTPRPGQSIGDTVRSAVIADTFEILTSDGIPVGTIVAYGPSSGSAPPGSPLAQTMGNFAITGGTGAFVGVRGTHGGTVGTQRSASVTEDPANRRLNGGPPETFALRIIPLQAPQIITRAGEPAVFHSDFSAVTAANPAKAGEVLIGMAIGLGPTRPGVDPGQPFPPFPANPLQLVNSPVNITVNGQSGRVTNAIGWPGLLETYRIDFQVPPGTVSGMAAIQVTAAWITGTSVNIPVE